MRQARGSTALLAVLLGACAAGPEPTTEPAWTQPVDPVSLLSAFALSDPSAWRGTASEAGGCELELAGASSYRPPHRSPLAIALIDAVEFGDFVLDAELLQTGREYAHRDLCVFFGWQSPERFYYAHLASRADPNAHNVFVVDGAARTPIAEPASAGIEWGQALWHRVRVERRLGDGSIRVFFDDMRTPVFEARDRRFGFGRVGFGSFDDTGRFRAVAIRGATRGAAAPAFAAR